MESLKHIQNELKAPKNQTNTFGGYKYRSAEDILEAVKPLLYKYNCTLTISDDIVEVGGRIYVKATATLKDGSAVETATAFAREPETKKDMDDAQVTGSTSSYARKYALNGLFAIDDTKDADYLNKGEEKKTTIVKTTKLEMLRNKLNELVQNKLTTATAIRTTLKEDFGKNNIDELTEVEQQKYIDLLIKAKLW